MRTCLIISGGDFSFVPEDIHYDYVIACDRGYLYAGTLGIKPDIMIGDFDSLDKDLMAGDDVPVKEFPVRKDDTDTMLAIKHALSEGYDHIIICCALGGRLDHTIANIQSMAYAAVNGAVCEIVSDNEYTRTFTGGVIEIPRREGFSFSLFSLSDRCTGITIKGSSYDCSNVELTGSFPLGISNKWKEDKITLEMTSGTALIVQSRL